MKKALTLLLLFFSLFSFSQIGIGTPTPNASAALDITSSTRGFLFPRMDNAQKKAIPSPAAGLVVWCTDCGTNSSGELQVYNGTTWLNAGVVKPESPTINSVTLGDKSVTINFTAPASNGGSTVTGYTVSSTQGGFTIIGTSSPITINGLTNGTAYTFNLVANNAAGSSTAATITATPRTVPGAPTTVAATAGNSQASVAFTPPASTGGNDIFRYTVTSNPGGIPGTGTSSPIVVTGLTNGTAYSFTVVATNEAGNSPASSQSNTVIPLNNSTNGTAAVSNYTCEVASSGTLTVGVTPTGVTRTITANVTALGTYSISATANGVIFEASGTFTGIGFQNIVLTAREKPIAVGTHTFTLNTSIFCSFQRNTVVNPSSNGTAAVSNYNCEAASSGTLTAGVTTTGAGVTQTIRLRVDTIGTYDISTNTNNGVTFSSGTRTFTTTGFQDIVLTASGTPVDGRSFLYILNTNACNFSRTAVNQPSSNGSAIVSFNSCTIASAGTMTAGVTTTGAGVTQTISVNVTKVGTYSISASANGVTFTGSGTFTSLGDQNIILTASSIPTSASASPYRYTLNTTPSCNFDRTVSVNPSSGGDAVINTITNCATTVTGSMVAGVQVSGVSQTISVNVTKIGTYSISTNQVNGVTFTASSNFTTTGSQTIVLTAEGIPTSASASPYRYTLNTTPSCYFDRTVSVNPSSGGDAVINTITNCTTTVTGSMVAGVQVSGVSQTISVYVSRVGTYDIATNQVNGVTFTTSGTFTGLGNQNIVLTASGKPVSNGENNFTLNTSPNCFFYRTTLINPSSNGTAAVDSYSCDVASVGTMTAGVTTTDAGVTQTITADVTTLGTYSISTTANGVTFAGSGTFTGLGLQNIVLTASSTPTSASSIPYSYTLNTTPNCIFYRTVSVNPSSGDSAVFTVPISNCATTVTGSMVAGVQVSGVSQTITVNVIAAGSYNISTTNNGVTFEASGNFTSQQTGSQNITLIASGTPTFAGSTFSYVLNTTSGCMFNRSVSVNPSSGGNAVIDTIPNCATTVTGSMVAGVQVSGVSQTISVYVSRVGTYDIATNQVNGVTFTGRANFTTTGSQTIVLTAVGIPTSASASSYRYTLNTTPSCNFDRTVTVNPSSGGDAVIDTIINCNTTVTGSMVAGVPVSGVSQTIRVYVSTVGTYDISTNRVNGVAFTGTANFTTEGSQTIVLTADGTPTTARAIPYNYTLNTTPSCNFTRLTVNPCATPDTPVITSITPGDGQVIINLAPHNTNTCHGDVLNYDVFDVLDQDNYWLTQNAINNQITITGLTNGTPYRFWVIANYSSGIYNTEYSNRVTATPCTVPGAPTGVAAIAGNTQARVQFNTPPSNGSDIDGYLVISDPGGLEGRGTSSPIFVSNLTNGIEYTFFVFAHNGEGNSPASIPSNPVIPSGNSTNGSALVSNYNCGTSVQTMTAGVTTTGAGITQTITATVETIGTYSISASANGVTFTGSGTFTGIGQQTIVLTASDKPVADGEHKFTLNTSPNCFFYRTTLINPSSNGTAAVNSYNCGGAAVGTMTAGVTTTDAGVTQTITADVTTLGTYSISTSANGVTFAGSGTFTSLGSQTIVLTASGKPVSNGEHTFTLNTSPNCSFDRITLVNPSSNGTAAVDSYSCNGTSVGTMTASVTTTDAGVTQTITADVANLGTYSISASANGVTFTGSGTFTGLGEQTIVLTASGIPVVYGEHNFTLNTSPNCLFPRTTVANPTSNGTAVVESYICDTASAGTLLKGVTPSGVTQTITANVTTLGTYNIITNTNNGITFTSGIGTFTSLGSQDIVLTASGIPDLAVRSLYQLNTSGFYYFLRTTVTVPDAPIITSLEAFNGQIKVNITPPSYDGGSPITGYNIYSNIGNVYNVPVPYTFNVTNGVTNTFYATAVNINGNSVNSNSKSLATCGANTTTAGVYLVFACYNLGAPDTGNPFAYQNGDINGDLYQWGRKADGHQIRTSATVATQATNTIATAPPSVDGKFIIDFTDWISTPTNNLWGDGTTGNNPAKADPNDPCPPGYKVPSKAQWGSIFKLSNTPGPPSSASANTWTWTGGGYAIQTNGATTLFLPAAGLRNSGGINNVGSFGHYWSSTATGANSNLLQFKVDNVSPANNSLARGVGFSVRCVKE